MSTIYGEGYVVDMNDDSTRIVSGQPVGIRWLLRKDGSMVLQFAQAWQSGRKGGVEWVDVPIVSLGAPAGEVGR